MEIDREIEKSLSFIEESTENYIIGDNAPLIKRMKMAHHGGRKEKSDHGIHNSIDVHLVNEMNKYKANPGDLVTLASSIEKAYNYVNLSTVSKLGIIRDQMDYLCNQAVNIIKEAELTALLHSLSCNFEKRPGFIYHIYKKPNGHKYFSMISPTEWGDPPHAFVGSFKLEENYSWTAIKKDNLNTTIKMLLDKDSSF